MKKIWAMRKETDGVSPVIATILMVAITVVLAAVLYVMVLGIGGPGTTVPAVGTTKATDANNNTWTISAIGGGASVLKSDVYVQLSNASGFVITTELLSLASGTHGFTYSSASGAAGLYLQVGDSFKLSKTYTTGCKITLVTAGAAGQYAVLTV